MIRIANPAALLAAPAPAQDAPTGQVVTANGLEMHHEVSERASR